MEFNLDYFTNDLDRIVKTKTKKRQIILCNTGASISEHLVKFNTRFFGKYNKIPTFTISLTGEIYKHFDPKYSSELLGNDIDKYAITISLENLGGLSYDPIRKVYVNWAGEEYFNEVIEVPWRNKVFWATYSETQIHKLIELVDFLCKTYNIEHTFIGHNTVIDNPNEFNGIINRSNYNKIYHDLSPAMDFEYLNEYFNKTNIKK